MLCEYKRCQIYHVRRHKIYLNVIMPITMHVIISCMSHKPAGELTYTYTDSLCYVQYTCLHHAHMH